jgi:CDP-diacylglycerol--serine O-phosphatidyltransferase
MLVFLAMVFDALDGKIARITRSSSEFGAQLDSFSDMLTFGVVPAMLAKVLIEHEGPLLGYAGHPRLHFLAAAAFALMAILRLARFNLETDQEESDHTEFRGLPSPAAAGALTSTIWLYLVLRRPEVVEFTEGGWTPFGRLMGWMEAIEWAAFYTWLPVLLVALMIVLGLLMVSRIRYTHMMSALFREGREFFTLVALVFALFLFYLAPVPALFLSFGSFVLYGPLRALLARGRARAKGPEKIARAG